MWKYGSVYYVLDIPSHGSEPRGRKPAIVISNDSNNKFSNIVQVVFLAEKEPTLPTHVPIPATGRIRASIAQCEAVTPVAVDRLENYLGDIDPDTMMRIRKGIRINLNMEQSQEDISFLVQSINDQVDRLNDTLKTLLGGKEDGKERKH